LWCSLLFRLLHYKFFRIPQKKYNFLSICINGSYRVKFIIKQTVFAPGRISEVTKSVTFPYSSCSQSFLVSKNL
jgi:hypothetical protein